MAEKKIPLDLKKIGKAKPKPKKKRKKTGSFFKRMNPTLKKVFVGMGAALLVCFVVATAILVSYIKDTPPFDPEALFTVETSYVYDRDGLEVTQLHDEQNRIALPLEEIPLHVQQAFVAIEDERFYRHKGFDTIGFTRALWVNIRTRSFTQGASTISQQLVQNAFLGRETKIKRKAQEIWLALQLERAYSKHEILEMYLNRMFFGNWAYGVEAAAQTYFAKSISDVNIAEAAMLAGMINWPRYGNPFYNEEYALNRMEQVLNNMLRLGYISDSERAEALFFEFIYGGEAMGHEYPYPYFIDYVLHHELIEVLTGLPEFETVEEAYKAIYTGGLRIYTTLDPAMQQHVEDTLNKNELYPQTLYINIPKIREAIRSNNGELPQDYPDAYIDEEHGIPQPQSAMVLSDPRTGEVHALGGGRDYSKKRNELLRYLSRRQPGSAIKPLITYAPALEEGILGAGSALDDSPIFYLGVEPWYPENYDSTFRGMVTVRDALAYSYNIPAVRAYEMVGAQKGARYAHDMGISTFNPLEATLSWTLGAREVTAKDMAEAFGVFANDGIRMELYTVQRIEDRRGRVIYEKKAEPRQVLSEQASFMMNNILQDVVSRTTAVGLQATRPMAAKTGTTDDYRDVYLVAYTPNVVASFWMGYDEKIMGRITGGWNYTTRMVREVFTELFKTLPVEQFSPMPQGVVSVEVCTKSGLLPSDECREAETVRADYFLADHVPRLRCDMHITLSICGDSGLIASELCPEDLVTTKAFFNRPEYLTTDHNWKRGAGRKPDDAEERAPSEQCDIHTEHAGEITLLEYESLRHNLVVLTWEYDPGENGSEASSFHLVRVPAFPLEPQVVLDGEARSYNDYSVTYGPSYTYTIYAVNHQGVRSEPVSETVDITEEPQEPEKPELQDPEVNGTTVKLKWDQEGPEHVDEYLIYCNGELIASGLPREPREYTHDEDLEPGPYTYYVVAKNPGYEVNSDEKTIDIEEDDGGDTGDSRRRSRGLAGLWARFSRLLAGLALRI